MYSMKADKLSAASLVERLSYLCDAAGAPNRSGRFKFIADILDTTPKTVTSWFEKGVVPRPRMLHQIAKKLRDKAGLEATANEVVHWLQTGEGDIWQHEGVTQGVSHEELSLVFARTLEISKSISNTDLYADFDSSTKEKIFDKIIALVATEVGDRSLFINSDEFEVLVGAVIKMAKRKIL